MIAFAYFLLKSALCAGVLYGYYLLALRNRVFHHWNRYYLLATVALSLTLPILRIPVKQSSAAPPTAVRFIEVAASGDRYVSMMDETAGFHIDTEQWMALCYALVGLLFLTHLLVGLSRIRQLLKKHPVVKFGDIGFVLTREKGTPFSFWRYIFWHEDVNVDSDTGRQMLKHEMVHVREGHTFDRLFVNAALVVGWANPFLWLIRREMEMIHEFIADRKSVDEGDTASFAAMILQSAYPGRSFPLTQSFFHSPIKRRLHMLMKNKDPRTGYVARIMALPMAATLFAAFALRPAEATEIKAPIGTTSISEAGSGVFPENGSPLSVSESKAAAAGDTSPVKIMHGMTFLIKTDDPESLDTLRKMLVVIGDKRYTAADIVNWEISADSIAVFERNDPEAVRLYGEAGRNGVMNVINPKSLVMKAPEKELSLPGMPQSFILKNPAVDTLPEAGSSTTRLRSLKEGADPLIVIDGQKVDVKMNDLESVLAADRIKTINVLKGESAVKRYGEEGRNGVIEITSKQGKGNENSNGQSVKKIVMGQPIERNPDGKGYVLRKMDGSDITYVQRGPMNGVAEQEPAFTKVETAPVFNESGGDVNAWLRGLAKSLEKSAEGLKGKCKVRFIVERSGRPTSFSIVNEQTTNLNLAYWVLGEIKDGPTWKPGMQNGEAVAVVQEISFKY